MEKQTAVSILKDKLQLAREFYGNEFDEIFEQAIEIERQQIVEAFEQGQAKEAKEAFWTKGNDYYNQTFKQ